MNKKALWIRVGADDWTAERAMMASIEFERKFIHDLHYKGRFEFREFFLRHVSVSTTVKIMKNISVMFIWEKNVYQIVHQYFLN